MTTTLDTIAVTSPRAVRSQRPTPAGRALALLRRVPTWLTILFLVVVTAYPLFWMFINSLKSNTDFLNNPSYASRRRGAGTTTRPPGRRATSRRR